MNRKQKTCLLVSIAAVVAMGLFPPWVLEYERRHFTGGAGVTKRYEFRYTTEPGPYSWIGAPLRQEKPILIQRGPPREAPNLLTCIVLVSSILLLLL